MHHAGAIESAYVDELSHVLALQQEEEERKEEGSSVGSEGEQYFLGFGVRWSSFERIRYVAKGGMCNIYRCRHSDRDLVIKVPRKDIEDPQRAVDDLDTELAMLQIARHPNIVRLAGAGTTPEGATFVLLEDLSGGTLAHFLGTESPGAGMPRWLFRKLYMSLGDALAAAAGVASALAYLHDRVIPGTRVVHRDVKSTNIALAADGATLKLFDFGLARILRPQDRLEGTDKYKLTGGTGSLRYMAPEVALEVPYNEKADVFSFAIVLWEILALRQPFGGYTAELMMEQVVKDTDRPPLSEEWPAELKQLLQSMWHQDPPKRPPMHQVVEVLRSLAAAERRAL